jgi:imidazolonepropionase-like amidohydrolase
MRVFKNRVFSVLVSFSCVSFYTQASPLPNESLGVGKIKPAQTIIYAKGALIGTDLRLEKSVIIALDDGKIVSISTDQQALAELPERFQGSKFIDLSCCYISPGLIDTQTHLESQPGSPPKSVRISQWTDADFTLIAMENAGRTLAAGFTTIRDMGHSGESVFAVQRAVEQGIIPGPRMQVAGEVVRPTGGELRPWLRPKVEKLMQVDAICDGPSDCKRAVRAAVARGATTIKVETKQDLTSGSASQFDLDELVAIRSTAHVLGVKVTASAFSIDSMNLALSADFDAVVHGTYTDKKTFSLLKEKKSFYIPTLLAAKVVYELANDSSKPFSDSWRKENIAIYHGMVESFKQALVAGVPIAFGTDAGWRPHGQNAEQLLMMQELGMSSEQAIKSATVNAAQVMGWEDKVGALNEGMYADLVVTTLNPLEYLEALTAPMMVIKNGEVVHQEQLP